MPNTTPGASPSAAPATDAPHAPTPGAGVAVLGVSSDSDSLLAGLCAEQRLRWVAGDRVLAEALLAERHLDLQDEQLLDLIYHEVLLREQWGETPCLEQYLERFPGREAALRLRFTLYEALACRVPEEPRPDRPAAVPSACWPLLDRFERAWQEGTPPDLDAFLPEPLAPNRRTVLLELVQMDLECRHKKGLALPVEDYLRRYPELAEDDAVFELAAWEFELRRRDDPDLDLAEYARRFPTLGSRLAGRLASLSPPSCPVAVRLPGWARTPAALPPSVDSYATLPPGRPAQSPSPAPLTGWPAVPGYEVLGELGKGGMGVVFKARQAGFGRTVALKMIRHAEAGLAERVRFRVEVEAVGRLQHPNVVQVFEAGEHLGTLFFSMEYCPGGNLAGRLDGTPWPAERAALLVRTLAEAVHAAHRAGVIHRDLKPANVLLAADGTPKVADFGLAKLLDEDGRYSCSGAVLGTPNYMAPEQAEGRSRHIGPAADVWALGAILYELLTGRAPFVAANPLDTLLQVVHQEPVPLRRLLRLPRDLETICLKCLLKDPAKRYTTARDLADDLGRFLESKPIQARRAGLLARAHRWARRRPGVAALLGVLLLVTAGGFGGVVASWREAVAARKVADREATARTEAWQAEALQHYFTRIALAERELQAGKLAWAQRQLAQCPPELCSWEWHYLARLCQGERGVATLPGHPRSANAVAWRPGHTAEGPLLASGGADGCVRLWEAPTGRLRRVLKGHTRPVNGVAFSPDGRLLASAGSDRLVIVRHAATGLPLWTLRHEQIVSAVTFHPDGRSVVSATYHHDRPGEIRLWSLADGRLQRAWPAHTLALTGLAFTADGRLLASCGLDRAVRLWDCRTGRAVLTFGGHTRPVAAVACSPNGPLVASAAGRLRARGPSQGEVLLWQAETGRVVHRLQGHAQRLAALCFSPDGSRLATAGWDREIKLWDVATGQEVLTLTGHKGTVLGLAFSPDGTLLASAGSDGAVKVWDGRPAAFRDGKHDVP
jgi:WD40 repeat protein